MAFQVSHIVYAKKYFDKLAAGKLAYQPGKIDKDFFLLGCVFPDIRRIEDHLARKDTHLRFSPIDLDFSGLSSFEAGWKFHLFCDMRREELLNNYEFYKFSETAGIDGIPAKLLEDELVYENYNNWEKIVGFFNNPPFIETNLGISKGSFFLWYAMIAKYVEKKPTAQSMRAFLIKQSTLASKLDQITQSISEMRKNKKALEILKKINEEIV